MISQQTPDIEPMLVHCWADVVDADQHRTNIGSMSRVCYDDVDSGNPRTSWPNLTNHTD